MNIEINEIEGYKYIQKGEGEPLLLLYGLFGAPSNWESVINRFGEKYEVIIPLLPIYELSRKESTVDGLANYIGKLIRLLKLDNITLIGNSLGGHIALVYALRYPERISRLVLVSSSGLFESSLGTSFVKRGDYDYIKERVEYTFFDPSVISEEYVNEVFEVANNNKKALRIISIAKSAQRHNLAGELPKIKIPTLLVWGLNDTITPSHVAHDFNKLMKNSTLRFIDKCCHVPMMERPEEFNDMLEEYLEATASNSG